LRNQKLATGASGGKFFSVRSVTSKTTKTHSNDPYQVVRIPEWKAAVSLMHWLGNLALFAERRK
jgi:hypothetical protein